MMKWNMHTPLVSDIVCTNFKIKENTVHTPRMVTILDRRIGIRLRTRSKQCALNMPCMPQGSRKYNTLSWYVLVIGLYCCFPATFGVIAMLWCNWMPHHLAFNTVLNFCKWCYFMKCKREATLPTESCGCWGRGNRHNGQSRNVKGSNTMSALPIGEEEMWFTQKMHPNDIQTPCINSTSV